VGSRPHPGPNTDQQCPQHQAIWLPHTTRHDHLPVAVLPPPSESATSARCLLLEDDERKGTLLTQILQLDPLFSLGRLLLAAAGALTTGAAFPFHLFYCTTPAFHTPGSCLMVPAWTAAGVRRVRMAAGARSSGAAGKLPSSSAAAEEAWTNRGADDACSVVVNFPLSILLQRAPANGFHTPNWMLWASVLLID
jgi:hypothetical protein